MSYVLEANYLSKRYGNIQALNNLSFSVEKGSIFGILGPNGSGKTTCLSILLDAIKADSGTYQWFGEGISHHLRRRKIGALLETPNFYPYLSGAQNLSLVSAIKGKGEKNIHTALKITGLNARRNSRFKDFSLGMKQRLAIASVILSNPQVLVLDEPTNGLDPQGIAEIRSLIKEIWEEGKTILLASHLLDEVEKVCTHVAILKSGSLISAGKVSDVIGTDNMVEIAAENLESLRQFISEMNGVIGVENGTETLILKFKDPVNTAEINRFFFDKGITLTQLKQKKKTLEAQFLEITSHA